LIKQKEELKVDDDIRQAAHPKIDKAEVP